MRIYLASPYTHPDSLIMQARFRLAESATLILMKKGYLVFSPIVYSHPLAKKGKLPRDYTYWRVFNESWIDWADQLVVLELDHWKESVGVRAEIEYAVEARMNITSIEFDKLLSFPIVGVSDEV